MTHRDFCSSVHIITGHRRADHSYDIDFDALKRTGGTLVFLMGIAALPDICAGLLSAGMDPATPAAVLERGTTARQHRISATLGTLTEVCAKTTVHTPAIIVVGRVVSLADSFAWAEKRPLAGLRVLLTRPKALSSGMAALLREKGAEVLENPAIETVPVQSDALEQAIERLVSGGYDWLVFTSPSGVRIFFDAFLAKRDIRALGGVKLAAIGQGSRKALAEYGVRADFLPTVYDGETLGRELGAHAGPGQRVLIPRAAIGNPALAELLTAAGMEVTDLATYDTVYPAPRALDVAAALRAGEVDFAVFTSASTVHGLAQSCPEADFTALRAVCIGKQTAAAAQGLSETISAMSFFSGLWLLTPTWMPPAAKPLAAHTPPSMLFQFSIVRSLQYQPRRLGKSQREVHILNGGAGCALAQIVEQRRHGDARVVALHENAQAVPARQGVAVQLSGRGTLLRRSDGDERAAAIKIAQRFAHGADDVKCNRSRIELFHDAPVQGQRLRARLFKTFGKTDGRFGIFRVLDTGFDGHRNAGCADDELERLHRFIGTAQSESDAFASPNS